MLDTLIHRWMRIPYALNVHYLQTPKKPRATVLFIHGIGNTGAAWDDVTAKLPDDIRVISIDLLGFGSSPAPKWAVYNAKTQASAVLATYLKLRILSPAIVVGHSLGSLVAIEVTKRYPLLVRSLILCSPPLYEAPVVDKRLNLKSDAVLRELYRTASKHPDDFVRLSAVAMKYQLINKSFNVTDDNIASYMAALEAMIINQTSLGDAQKLNVPTTIIRGTLDPFVVSRNLKALQRHNSHIQVRSIIAGHEVRGRYVQFVVREILKTISEK